MLSIIIPAYNEKQNIERTAETISGILVGKEIPYELVFISDGSTDGTYGEIRRLAERDARVRGAEFSRNFGKEAAIFAGLELALGDACIVMDCDLQHPPEVIPGMYELWQEGYEVVEGIKKSRGKESIFHGMSAGIFYGIMSKMMKMDMRSSSDFKLLDRKGSAIPFSERCLSGRGFVLRKWSMRCRSAPTAAANGLSGVCSGMPSPM